MIYQISKKKVPTAYVTTNLSLVTFVQAYPVAFSGAFEWLNTLQLHVAKIKSQWVIIEPITGIYVAEGITQFSAFRDLEVRLDAKGITESEFQSAIQRSKSWMETHQFAIKEKLKMMRLNASFLN
jgi:hypothetical protein